MPKPVEVERKFILAEKDRILLLSDSAHLNRELIRDEYYDNNSYALARKGCWLRSRNGKFELKIPLQLPKPLRELVQHYKELKVPDEISSALGFSEQSGLEAALKENNYDIYCVCITARSNYRKGKFNICLDEAEFKGKDFKYSLAEIEIMAEEEKRQEAESELMNFARLHKLSMEQPRGKIVEYMRRFLPEHYKAFKDAGWD